MTVRHYLIGYGKGDEPEIQHIIPQDRLLEVKRLLALYPDDPDALDPYELLAWQAKQIAALAGKTVNTSDYHFFLQAFTEPDAAADPHTGRQATF